VNLDINRLKPTWPAFHTWSVEARLLYWLTFLWLGVGLAILFSASYYEGLQELGDGFYYLSRQLLWIGMGLVAFFLATSFPLRQSLNWAWLGFGICWVLIWATHINGVGVTTMGATRWISIGGFQLQPSELMKPFMVLQSAWVFGKWPKLSIQARIFWLGLFALMLLGILKQPNLSTTALCGMSLWLIALAAGLPLWQLLCTALAGIGVAVLSMVANPYQWTRVSSFVDPWKDEMGAGFQLSQSLLAVGSGKFWGTGFGLGHSKLFYLPVQHSDFIFAVYAEEFGLVGSILLLALLALYGALALRIANKIKHPTHRLVAVGAMVVMLLQAIINIGVAIGALPTTGLPFPLFSYGGSSMIASLGIAGLLIRVAREGAQSGKVVPLPTPAVAQTSTSASSSVASFPSKTADRSKADRSKSDSHSIPEPATLSPAPTLPRNPVEQRRALAAQRRQLRNPK
jgi:cell division protein FtsW